MHFQNCRCKNASPLTFWRRGDLLPLARLLAPLEVSDFAEAAVAAAECPRAEGEIHEDEGGRALGHDGRGAALVGARAPHAAVVFVARRIRVRLAVVAFAAAENR